MPNPPALTRRTALSSLVLAGGGVLSGCTSGSTGKAGPAPEDPNRPDPDVALAALALAAEQETLALLEGAAKRHRGLRPVLAPMIAAHRAHVDLLADAAPASPFATAAPSAGGSTALQGAQVSIDPRKALAALADAEETLGTTIQTNAFAARSGQFARLLASMSAACSQHAAVLSTTTVQAGRR